MVPLLLLRWCLFSGLGEGGEEVNIYTYTYLCSVHKGVSCTDGLLANALPGLEASVGVTSGRVDNNNGK